MPMEKPTRASTSSRGDAIEEDPSVDDQILGNGQPDAPLPDGRTTAIFSGPRTDDGRKAQSPYDCIDECLMQSFPCSDPPSYSSCRV